jgi:hypothetical protein
MVYEQFDTGLKAQKAGFMGLKGTDLKQIISGLLKRTLSDAHSRVPEWLQKWL